MTAEIAAWSDDTVSMDEKGLLYFLDRQHEMIKTFGHHVSPTEIEAVVLASGLVGNAAARLPRPALGQTILLMAAPTEGKATKDKRLFGGLRWSLLNFVIHARIDWRVAAPRSPIGEYDWSGLTVGLKHLVNGGPDA